MKLIFLCFRELQITVLSTINFLLKNVWFSSLSGIFFFDFFFCLFLSFCAVNTGNERLQGGCQVRGREWTGWDEGRGNILPRVG